MSTATATLTTPETLEANLSHLSLSASPTPSKRPYLPRWKAPPPTKQEVEWADILTVDLSLYDTDKPKLIETVQTALQRDGFFYVVGHGIDTEEVSMNFKRSRNVELMRVVIIAESPVCHRRGGFRSGSKGRERDASGTDQGKGIFHGI